MKYFIIGFFIGLFTVMVLSVYDKQTCKLNNHNTTAICQVEGKPVLFVKWEGKR